MGVVGTPLTVRTPFCLATDPLYIGENHVSDPLETEIGSLLLEVWTLRPRALDGESFDQLAAASGELLVSILLPTHVKGPDIAQNRIRLKNLVGEVDEQLERAGWKTRDRERRLHQAQELLADHGFWEHQAEGLAVYIDDAGEVLPISVPDEVDTLATVSGTYHVRYLIPSLHAPRLQVLVLARKGVRLYEVSRHDASRAEVDLPNSMDDVNWFMDREAQLQSHPDSAGSAGYRHGHDPADRSEEDLKRFLRAVADALPDQGREGPLVMLGEGSLVGPFSQICTTEIVSPPDGGIQDVDHPEEVYEKAAPVIAAQERSFREDSVELALEHLGIGDAVTSIADALESAVSGRISQLILNRRAEPKWGRFDPATLRVEPEEKASLGVGDLIDRVAAHTLASGAEIRMVDTPIEGHAFVAVPRF